MIDIEFVQFYIKKKYDISLEQYFDVTSAVASTWRRKSFPKNRLNEFMVREENFNIYQLFEKIYPKNQI